MSAEGGEDARGREDLPPDFRRALAGLAQIRDAARPPLSVSESPAPGRLAPFGVSLSATVNDGDVDLAQGRLILLCDPAGQVEWQGRLRFVVYVRAELEEAMVTDPLVAEVAWAWLAESLAAHGVGATAAAGAVTRVQTQSFTGLHTDAPDGPDAPGLVGGDGRAAPTGELEIRASWSPATFDDPAAETAGHAQAWLDVLCTAAGIPPTPSGVHQIPKRR